MFKPANEADTRPAAKVMLPKSLLKLVKARMHAAADVDMALIYGHEYSGKLRANLFVLCETLVARTDVLDIDKKCRETFLEIGELMMIGFCVTRRCEPNDFKNSKLMSTEEKMLQELHFVMPGAIAILANVKLDLQHDLEEVEGWAKIFATGASNSPVEARAVWMTKHCKNDLEKFKVLPAGENSGCSLKELFRSALFQKATSSSSSSSLHVDETYLPEPLGQPTKHNFRVTIPARRMQCDLIPSGSSLFTKILVP